VSTVPPAASGGRPGRHAAGGRTGVTRIVQTEELPPGVDALTSADGRTIIVRASLDQVSRRRAMRAVMASVRRLARLALYPAISLEAIRGALRRVAAAASGAGQAVQQVAASPSDHASGLAMAVTAAAGRKRADGAGVGLGQLAGKLSCPVQVWPVALRHDARSRTCGRSRPAPWPGG
jgi:hypothetical protein